MVTFYFVFPGTTQLPWKYITETPGLKERFFLCLLSLLITNNLILKCGLCRSLSLFWSVFVYWRILLSHSAQVQDFHWAAAALHPIAMSLSTSSIQDVREEGWEVRASRCLFPIKFKKKLNSWTTKQYSHRNEMSNDNNPWKIYFSHSIF